MRIQVFGRTTNRNRKATRILKEIEGANETDEDRRWPCRLPGSPSTRQLGRLAAFSSPPPLVIAMVDEVTTCKARMKKS